MSRWSPETLVLPARGGSLQAPPGLSAIVLGGGIAGLSAATVLCERGVRVQLIEREPVLGGRAGGFAKQLATGERVEMERGFHAFFRQYYNLRALLRRVDPELAMLAPLPDYPILGPAGKVQSFADLPTQPPFQVMALTWRTPYLSARDLLRVDGRAALEMLRYAPERTYRRWDHTSAAAYLDSLAFPEAARRMLFDVFSHSFFNPEEELSAAELLMMFHFYFMGNPEGLVFDVVRRPLSTALWTPLGRWLEQRGCTLALGASAQRVEARAQGGYRVQCAAASYEADMLVLALDVDGLRGLVQASPALSALGPSVSGLAPTRPFAVQRLWLDRRAHPDRAAFAGTTGVGILDNISVYERLQDESARWTQAHGGSVIELHAYAVSPESSEQAIRRELAAGLHALYPELREARSVDECFLLRRDCPAFPVGFHAVQPRVETALPGIALAGDFIQVPLPCALMERATVSGMLAANQLLAAHGVAAEPLRSVPPRGLLAPGAWTFRRKPSELRRSTHAA